MTYNPTPCQYPGCTLTANSRYCSAHYKRMKEGDIDRPIINRGKPGDWYEWRTDKNGYVRRAKKNANGTWSHEMQHRVVMAEILGRELLPGENVHHINGVRSDNRPENLELWVTTQPAGQRPTDLIAWAHEILNRYE